MISLKINRKSQLENWNEFLLDYFKKKQKKVLIQPIISFGDTITSQ